MALAVGIGAVAAAGVVWRLDQARREQAHARHKGRLLRPNRPAVKAAERRARAFADGESTMWADLGLRYLSGLVEHLTTDRAVDGKVPSLVMTRVGACGLEVVLWPSPPGRLGWFYPVGDGLALALDADLGLADLRALAEERWPVWPGLVSIGEAEGSTVLFNLEHAGSLSVEGDPVRVEGFLAAAALQLATQPWSHEMLSGLFVVGREHKGGPPVQVVDPAEAMDLAERLDHVSEAHQARAGDLPLSAWRALACEALPNVVVAFAGTPANALRCLAEAAVPERSGVALAGAGPFPGARWRVRLPGGSIGHLEGELGAVPLHMELVVTYDPEEVSLLSEAVGATSDREGVGAVEPQGGPAPGPPGPAGDLIDLRGDGAAPRHGTETVGPDRRAAARAGEERPAPAAGTGRGDVEVAILGPVDIIGGDLSAVETSRRMATCAVLAYLASHPRPVTADELASNLWPLDTGRDNLGGPQRKTVMNAVSRARAVLGYGLNGKERITYSPMGYRLGPDVTSDWARFDRFVTGAKYVTVEKAMANLRQALELVRGEPFGGAVSSQFFEWVASEHLDMTLSAKVVDVAQELGELALAADDLDTVLWACDRGLQLDPTREELFRLWMHGYGRAGRAAKVDEVYRRLTLVLRQRVHPLSEPQRESHEIWRLYTSAEVPGPRS